MREEAEKKIVDLYLKGYSIRKIRDSGNVGYGREQIRKVLKRERIPLRGKATTYKEYTSFTTEEAACFAEILGYLYGDGSLHRNKNTTHGLYDCHVAFSLDETDLVKRVSELNHNLFYYRPRVVRNRGIFLLKFRRSQAKYFSLVGYPIGKKSVLNPHLPWHLLKGTTSQKSFICGFLNAEATVNKTIAVQQSVRISLTNEMEAALKEETTAYNMRGMTCYFIKWKKAKNILNRYAIKESNVLNDLKKLLAGFQIPSKIYPIRIYIGKHVGLHYELRISPVYLKNVKDLKMLTCEKKLQKLNHLLQG